MNELIKAEPKNSPAFLDLRPTEMVMAATEVANVLKDVIEKQQLFTTIQGKKYVKHEGWATLGSLLGFLPREKSVVEQKDGSFEAVVELYNMRTGQIVGQGSALCGMDEDRWKKVQKYARRSMAITRATGKAYRLGFAWVMALAGYEPTPAEEMPSTDVVNAEVIKEPVVELFDKNNPQHLERLAAFLQRKSVAANLYQEIAFALNGKEITNKKVDETISMVTG